MRKTGYCSCERNDIYLGTIYLMKKNLLLAFFFSFSASLFSQKLQTRSDALFYENKGQIIDQNGNANPDVKYLLNVGGLNVHIKKQGFSYDVYESKRTLKKGLEKSDRNNFQGTKKRPEYDVEQQFHRVDIDFVGANKNPQITAEGKSTDYDNYYNLPHLPAGAEKVHRFERITYKDLYANIDLVFIKPADSLKPVEYNFVVSPGGKISDIKLQFKGAKTNLKDGKISMALRFGEMQENIPASWTEAKGKKQELTVAYSDLGNDTYGFKTTQDTFDKTVIIDPVPTRIWGSYFGGSGDEFGWIKPDRFDNIFLHGYTSSANNVATSGSHQLTLAGGYDAFVNKITKDGQKVWGTYYGGQYWDASGGLDFDNHDNIFVVADIHIPNPAHPGNVYYYFGQLAILKFKPDGTLVYEKIFGGKRDEISYDLRYYNDNIYILGETFSDDLATPGAFQDSSVSGMQAGFVGKFKASDGSTEWISYITGNSYTTVGKIFNANTHGIEIIATTRATDFPMVNAFQPTSHVAPGSSYNNGLYLNFSETGALLRSSYVGENHSYYFESARRFGDEIFFGAHVYTKNQASFFIANLLNNTVVEKNIPVAYGLQTSTYIDVHRNLFIANYACPGDAGLNQVATPGAFMEISGPGCTSHFMKFDENLNKIWGTFYPGHTQIPFITKDNSNNIYFWGLNFGTTPGMVTPGTFQQTASSTNDEMFIAKFADCKSTVNISFSPTCIGQNLQLNASGGSTYEWFGPNNFHSTLQNPSINNAQAINSGEYFVRITGGQSCGGIFSLKVNIGSPTGPVLDLPALPHLTGVCSVTVTTLPTATTGCGTKITGVTSDPITYTIPGSFVIHWKFDDGEGNILTQNQNVTITGIAKPVASPTQSFCKIASPTIVNIAITGTEIKWYDAAGNALNTNTLLTDGTKYFATQTLSGCESAKFEITVTLNDPAPPTGNIQQDFCSAQNPDLSNLVVSGTDVKWYDSLGNSIPISTPLIDGETYYATQTVSGCESTTKLAVKVSVANGGIPAKDHAESICNDTVSTSKTVDLNDYKSDLIANTTDLTFEFYNASNQLILNPSNVTLTIGSNEFIVKISNTLGCFVSVKLNLTFNPKPALNLPTNAEFCNGQSVTLDAGAGFSSYEWTKDSDLNVISTSQTLTASEIGKYTVTVTNAFNCKNSASVTVTKSPLASITGVQIVNNTATVQMSETGDFLYSLDNRIWQISNVFSNLSNGNHTVYVKTSGGCVIGQMDFTIFNVSNSFSPNGDGKNDTWKVGGLENYPNSEITVLDRWGNAVLNKVSTGSFEWDGKLNSRPLPTGNYWYQIKVSDGRILNGWLLIKNRN
ncbi:hypothetical protein FIC_01588 [Flavobacteriaceae bacterium 3519-10]|nr:hypothetical protein FIC_01588 [Flavobacteriaceae bacterium 3519-10]